MNIRLEKVHISNYRSIQDLTINLRQSSMLFGKNDSGKSNIIRAIGLAFSSESILETDVYVSEDSPFIQDKPITVDVYFMPIDDAGNTTRQFNDTWELFIGDSLSTDMNDQQFFAYRTTNTFDANAGEFNRERRIIAAWDGDEITTGTKVPSPRLLAAFDFVLLDANRDISIDIRDRYSRWNKELSKIQLSDTATQEVETALSSLGETIVAQSPFLTNAQIDLGLATDNPGSETKISPISRSTNELYRGLDVIIKQNEGVGLPVSSYGSGTRSRAVFATLKTLINAHIEAAGDSPYYCFAAFEEPESHIHPQSQKQLVTAFSEFKAQRIMTTHSPSLLSICDIDDLIHVARNHASTTCVELCGLFPDANDKRKIESRVLNTRGEILFSTIVVLAEGETEERALPVFFETAFGYSPYELGVSIIGVGGKDNYTPYLRMLSAIKTKWLVFSDGEAEAVTKLQRQLQNALALPDSPILQDYPNIVVLDGGNNFESYLTAQGYEEEIIAAINEVEGCPPDNPTPFFDYRLGYGGGNLTREQLLAKLLKDGKTKYAKAIAMTICNCADEGRRLPQRIGDLIDAIREELGEAI
jgi:putative ATP-dependent endonuclease of OLD family